MNLLCGGGVSNAKWKIKPIKSKQFALLKNELDKTKSTSHRE
jgi:hypothetical protein